jgi:rSAM/selenodomain-associated transferase 1
MKRALIVVGKAPQAGNTKTRLVPPLSAEQAASLYRGFLLDAVHLGLSLKWERVTVVHPRGAAAILQTLLPSEVSLLEQRGSGLGEALAFAFQRHFCQGFDRVVLIGSDNPTLPAEPICEALAALDDGRDLCIGPCLDGGYYLLGMRAPWLGVFDDIEWSTSRVYGQTLRRARRVGLRVHAVRKWYDVDLPRDLDRVRRELRDRPDIALHTRAALDELESQVGGTSTVGARPDRSAYTRAMRSAAERPLPGRASITTEPPNPPPVIRAP